jgi:hypothetical protein
LLVISEGAGNGAEVGPHVVEELPKGAFGRAGRWHAERSQANQQESPVAQCRQRLLD